MYHLYKIALLAPLLACILTLTRAVSPAQAEDYIDILTSKTKQYSKYSEELIIRDFFQDRRDGFFVDVGCAWAKLKSNTYYLEKKLGWRGIGIDANPQYAAEWKQLRPESKFLQYIVTDASGARQAFYAAHGLGSVYKGRVHGGKEVKATELMVPTITLTDLLDEQGVTEIDLLSMDIEDSEQAALSGFDIDRFRPKLVCIEAFRKNRPFLYKYFKEHGYTHLKRYMKHDNRNLYFALQP